LSTALTGERQNNFDALRLLGATLVIVGHSYVLTNNTPVPRLGGIPLQTLGVCIFFAVSGNLITASWRRDPNLRRFVQRRALRVFPALWVVIALTVLVLGPVFSSVALPDYFTSSSTWTYLSGALLVPQYTLPGVFESLDSSTVNGSLWSLGVEFLCYLVVAAVGLVPRLFASLVGVLVVAAVLSSAMLSWGDHGGTWINAFGEVAPYFMVGALLTFVSVRVTRHLLSVGVVASIGWVGLADVQPELSTVLSWVAVTSLVVGAGARRTPVVSRASRFGDFSYGTYLWAYPVQQAVTLLLPPLPVWMHAGIALAVSLTIAAGSWHLIEKRALRLKPRVNAVAQPTTVE
jgi:peptidoglycan/LPS O-acetylase OafA/YrhL